MTKLMAHVVLEAITGVTILIPYIAGLVANYGISNTIVLELP